MNTQTDSDPLDSGPVDAGPVGAGPLDSDLVSSVPVTLAHVHRLMALMTGDEKHNPAAHSTLDVLHVLYAHVLRITPDTADSPTRDRFLLSKGHGPMAYYAVLAAHGFIPETWLTTWATYHSPLGHHPDHTLIPGVEISAGSLGHGLPIAVGQALGLRALGHDARVIVLVGDAELDEGTNAEAIQLAAATHLANLTVVAIDNHSRSYDTPGTLAAPFRAAGWTTERVNGRDHTALRTAFTTPAHDAPHLIIADTNQGH